MSQKIQQVAVIGAGTMGAGIAAHMANAGLPVLLLDIAPDRLTDEEQAQGLTLDSPQVRNRIVRRGFERAKNSRPPAFMSQAAVERVTLGNTTDDFDRLADADWIVEAIIEKQEPKQQLFARLEKIRKPGSIISTNTSGLPIAQLISDRRREFKRHFLGTHFFNPPRYLKLLEIIPTAETEPNITRQITEFGQTRLGKSVVLAKDTPNFIGNRLFSMCSNFAVKHAAAQGYSVEMVDALTGPLLGRPKTATFRLLDLVGIDVMAHIANNVYDLIPHDPYREVLKAPELTRLYDELLEQRRLGNKSGQGFYKREKDAEGNTVYLTLDLDSLEYSPAQTPWFEAVKAVQDTSNIGERVLALLSEEWRDSRAVQFLITLLCYEFAYAAAVAQEIAHNLKSIDDNMRWGFSYELGPFQLWDALGVARMVTLIEAEGHEVAGWVKTMLADGYSSFYRREDGWTTGYYDWQTEQYVDLPERPRQICIAGLRRSGVVIDQNKSATILDMGQGVLLLSLHAPHNGIDSRAVTMMARARKLLAEREDAVGLVIGSEGRNFCTGMDIELMGRLAERGHLDQVRMFVNSLQETLLALRYSRKPVVMAVHGRALGSGAELALAGARTVAHAESSLGLAEPQIMLTPTGSSIITLVRRMLTPAAQNDDDAAVLEQAGQILDTILAGRISGSAAQAIELDYLQTTDQIVMNREQLLYEAKQTVLAMIEQEYTIPLAAKLYAGGQPLYSALEKHVQQQEKDGHLNKYEALIGRKLAFIIAGSRSESPRWLNERDIFALALDSFLELIALEKTQNRVNS